MIRDLTVDNYRMFQHFKLDSIARVNLIVGANNSGKSSLLEAIHLLTSDDIQLSLVFILSERGEFVSGTPDSRFDRRRSGGYQISQIFHSRLLKAGRAVTIQSSADKKITLRIIARSGDSQEIDQPPLFDVDEAVESLVFERNGYGTESPRKKMRVTEDGLLLNDRYIRRAAHPKGGSRLITTNYLGYDELAVLWDKITLTSKEDRVIEALQILEPKVERIAFTSSQTSNSGILLRLKEEEERIPLGSMGDGMRRILAIIASLVSVEDGTLLVDEIDTGLYHGVLIDMWRLVFETASKQNAQVFTTTHSWDCVKAFQQALDNFPDPNIGRLIRLEKSDDQIKVVPYSTNELDIAIEQGIEVR